MIVSSSHRQLRLKTLKFGRQINYGYNNGTIPLRLLDLDLLRLHDLVLLHHLISIPLYLLVVCLLHDLSGPLWAYDLNWTF